MHKMAKLCRHRTKEIFSKQEGVHLTNRKHHEILSKIEEWKAAWMKSHITNIICTFRLFLRHYGNDIIYMTIF